MALYATGSFVESRTFAFCESPCVQRNDSGANTSPTVTIDSRYALRLGRAGWLKDWAAVFDTGGTWSPKAPHPNGDVYLCGGLITYDWSNRLIDNMINYGAISLCDPNFQGLPNMPPNYKQFDEACWQRCTLTVTSTPKPEFVDEFTPATGTMQHIQIGIVKPGEEGASVDNTNNTDQGEIGRAHV